MVDIFLACLVFGCFSGLLAGLFGVGGGLVLVPFFVFLLETQRVEDGLLMLIAVATSLATIVVTSIVALMAHHRMGAIIWRHVYHLSLGILFGVVLGAFIADSIPASSLRFIFALYMLYVGVQMLMQRAAKQENKRLKAHALRAYGVLIGCVSAILGIGGGTLTVPVLARHHLPMRNAVAISSACGLPIALAGTVSYALLGKDKVGLPEASLGYVYLPAFLGIVLSSMVVTPVGARLANKLPTLKLKRYFAGLLLIVAAKLLWPMVV